MAGAVSAKTASSHSLQEAGNYFFEQSNLLKTASLHSSTTIKSLALLIPTPKYSFHGLFISFTYIYLHIYIYKFPLWYMCSFVSCKFHFVSDWIFLFCSHGIRTSAPVFPYPGEFSQGHLTIIQFRQCSCYSRHSFRFLKNKLVRFALEASKFTANYSPSMAFLFFSFLLKHVKPIFCIFQNI